MHNPYQQTRFLLGTPDQRCAPPDTGAEVAFAGRSNAGKSSALNAITGQRSLARTSKAPGRTREINFFVVRDDLRLVDLPGYGYAKVSKAQRATWWNLFERYLLENDRPMAVLHLLDSRHAPSAQDREVANLMGMNESRVALYTVGISIALAGFKGAVIVQLTIV